MTTYDVPTVASRCIPNIDGTEPPPPNPLDELARIPRTIPRSKVTEFIASLGLDLNDLPAEEDKALRIGGNCITATIYARNADGRCYLNNGTHEIAYHQIVIPVIDDTEETP